MMKSLAIIAALVLSILPALAQPCRSRSRRGRAGAVRRAISRAARSARPHAGAQDAIAKPPNGVGLLLSAQR
jgi:hypothetical protein